MLVENLVKILVKIIDVEDITIELQPRKCTVGKELIFAHHSQF
jgi:hypothetical protein